jgi:hypothetical protein
LFKFRGLWFVAKRYECHPVTLLADEIPDGLLGVIPIENLGKIPVAHSIDRLVREGLAGSVLLCLLLAVAGRAACLEI